MKWIWSISDSVHWYSSAILSSQASMGRHMLLSHWPSSSHFSARHCAQSPRRVWKSEGASSNPRPFEDEDFASYSEGGEGGGNSAPCPPVPTVLLPNCYWTLMGNPVKEEKIKWVSKDVFSQNNFCSKTRCFLFSSQLLLKHTWANPRSRGGDKFPKYIWAALLFIFSHTNAIPLLICSWQFLFSWIWVW